MPKKRKLNSDLREGKSKSREKSAASVLETLGDCVCTVVGAGVLFLHLYHIFVMLGSVLMGVFSRVCDV